MGGDGPVSRKNKRFYGSLLILIALLIGCAFVQRQIEIYQHGKGVPVVKNEASFTDRTTLDEGDPGSVTTFYLTAMLGSEENRDSLFADVVQSAESSCEALIQVGDDEGPLAGELGFGRQSANASVRGRKNAGDGFQIRLQQDAGRYHGQQVINLVKSRKHGARFLSELLFHTAFKVPSLLSLQTSLVHLYVRDLTNDNAPDGFVDYGLYTQIEQLNRTALANHGLNENGALYEVRNFDFSKNDAIVLESDISYNEEAFNVFLENKGETDNEALLSLLDDIADESLSPDDFIEKHFDRDNLTSFLAFEILTGNKNTVTGNFALYSPLNGETWYLWPIDFDAAFDREEDTILSKKQDPSSSYGVSAYWESQLFQKCLKSDALREELLEKAQSLTEEGGALAPEIWSDEVDALASIVETYAFSDADKDGMPLTGDQYEELTERIRQAVPDYQDDLEDSVERPMPFEIEAPVAADGTLTLSFDSSYSFAGDALTYHIVLSKTPDGEYVYLDKETDDTTVSLPLPEPGQYFVSVTVQDSEGNEQEAANVYETENGTVYGVRCFWILNDGTIADDGE